MVDYSLFNSLIGTTLGNYLLEELIEQSEAGCVFRARNTVAGTLFRLRILVVPPNLKREDRIVYLGRFQQEANPRNLQHYRDNHKRYIQVQVSRVERAGINPTPTFREMWGRGVARMQRGYRAAAH